MKKIINIIAIALSALALSSCLDLSPKAQLADNHVWSKAENYQLFANQFYGWTRDFNGCFSDGPHSDMRSDLICSMNNRNDYSAGANAIPASDGNYGTQYKRIYYTNLLLKNAETFSNPDAIRTPVGAALFFRAYCHFELVQLYGDVILLTEPVDLNSEKLYGPRDNRLEVIKQCVADLKKAAELLPEDPKNDGEVCKYTALAFLSRVALYEGTWQKYHNNNSAESKTLCAEAADAAKQVIESGKYQLFYSDKLGPRDSYRLMFTLENVDCNVAKLTKSANKEYILAYRHDSDLRKIGLNITHAAFNNVAYSPTAKLAMNYRCQDGLPISISPLYKGANGQNTEFENRDLRMNGTIMMHGQKAWDNDTKSRVAWNETDEEEANCKVVSRCGNTGYPLYKWATERAVLDTYEGYDWPVIRYAEVLLNYAEAVCERDGSISDTDLDYSLNLVRARSNPSMTKLSNALISEHPNDMSMIEEIRAERTSELFAEGFRIDDLKRWKTAEKEMPMDIKGIIWKGTWYETNWASQSNPVDSEGRIIIQDGRVWDQKHYLLPLPSDELQLNPQLKQNPGWE
ncbi:MAG: RagB/SusD family nutrient uptake outer membrane protein [Bacteroidales bacterium]|nr:RagB/SusD family nutrient uptake outer membrane protein [Bacteroidales bacterium]